MLLTFALPLALTLLAAEAKSLSSDLALEASRRPPATVVEYYLLQRDGAVPERGMEGADPRVAVMALRRVEGERSLLLEREVTFREAGLRLRHTETLQGDSRQTSRRELLPAESRTWVADWTVGGDHVRTLAYGWRRPVHESIQLRARGAEPVVGPLELLDRWRWPGEHGLRGQVVPRSLLIDPAAAAAAPIEAEHTTSGMVVRREDGSLVLDAVRATLGDLHGSRWSDGDAQMHRIEELEYQRLVRRWTVGSRRPYVVALEQVPTRR